jgi:hypothetical protein
MYVYKTNETTEKQWENVYNLHTVCMKGIKLNEILLTHFPPPVPLLRHVSKSRSRASPQLQADNTSVIYRSPVAIQIV